ncbi:SDR family NAD(P)-dependent oxidoreductase [Neomoorella thermoacetica]|uniref:SDR family NAD(P)-dependent oxidoreductase n=1 Tax=Neomoorella thermoacetica TaxID=1525 RepID=UPI0004715B98|nr:3-oxoacyl-ACP reductase family protein [Moorella thermoacetica]
MELRFDGKNVLVTGGSTGIGRAAAIQFARDGADVIIGYNSSKEAAEEVVGQITRLGRRGLAVQADVAKKGDIKRLFSRVREFFDGKLDILVNNAGGLIKRLTIEQMEPELLDKVFDINLKSVFYCCQEALPMLERKPSDGYSKIINVTSIAGFTGGSANALPYSTAKGGVITLTRGLAKALANKGITVNAVSPGTIDTPFHKKVTRPEEFEAFLKTIPLGRAGEPEDVVGAIIYLASSAADYITGNIIHVNGGQFIG